MIALMEWVNGPKIIYLSRTLSMYIHPFIQFTNGYRKLEFHLSCWISKSPVLDNLSWLNFKDPPVDLHLIFEKWISKKWISTNSIFGLFRTWILQATQAVKIKCEKDQKTSSSKSIYRNPILKNKAQINRGWVPSDNYIVTH